MGQKIRTCQNQPKATHLNETQTHQIINWVKWVLTQLNPININVYWVLTGYPIRVNYNPSIIFTNHPTLKYPKPLQITKIPLNLKMTKISHKPKNNQNIFKNY